METGEFAPVNACAAADLLLFSYQGVRMLGDIMPLNDEKIPAGMLGILRGMLVKEDTKKEETT